MAQMVWGGARPVDGCAGGIPGLSEDDLKLGDMLKDSLNKAARGLEVVKCDVVER